MARRKANGLENQMSLMDMMASESPEYAEEDPAELLDTGEDMGDSEGQTDKPFKRVANKTTKAKASISTQTLKVVKAVYTDTVETNWEDLFDGFDRLYAITFSSGIEFVNKVINKFSYAEVVFGCEKIIANDIAAIMSVQIDSVQRLAKSKSAGNLANRLNDGSLQLYVSRDTKSHEKIFILESADHKHVRVITGSANMSASAFYGIQRENIVCFDDEAAFAHYKILFDTFKETCSDNVSYTKLFPLFGVMYGDSNGGKTTFIKFLVKLMCNETVKMNTTEDFTATKIDGLKRVCEGLPINIDDLAKTQFQSHSERIIKNDGWGVSERLINYPAVSITSNKITSLTKDLSKRAIICRIGAKIDNERGAKNSKRVNESMSELTTAFYGEYVRRMLVCIDEMTTEMRENANGKEYFPDIFYASSSVIADIFRACKIDLPVYAHILSYDDYMGDKSIGRAAIEKIELAWQADPNKFRVDKKKNRLIYSYPQDGPWYELKYIADELPNSLEAEISGGNQLVMNYEQAQELFGIKFRRWLGIFNL